jgi:hypothetical protein
MRRLIVLAICSVALVMSACSQGFPAPGGSQEPSRSSEPGPSGSHGQATPSRLAGDAAIPLCETVPQISAPADRYRESPIYVANEMPVEEIQAWAAAKPGFEEIWIDREHAGWITVAFSEDADARQAELEKEFPDVGAVVVGVDWTLAELEDLQRRVMEELGPLFAVGAWTGVTRGVIGINVGVLSDERIGAVEARFAGERVCVEGLDPGDAPAPGPQPLSGDGWRLLADERRVGEPYRTGIASDQASYENLWTEINLPDSPPPVDFESEVAIWFGAVYGSSCPNLRLDDVVVDEERSLVHAEIVQLDFPPACTDDANPHAYVVAVDRARLPAGPFAIQLGADDPPAGVPEERTLVDVDLSRPGAVARPGEVHGDPSLRGGFVLEPGSTIEPDLEYPYRLFVHCGIEWLGTFNGLAWRTDVPDGAFDYIPPKWQASVDADQTIELSITLRTDPEPVIEASASGHTVIYRPTTEDPPGCD